MQTDSKKHQQVYSINMAISVNRQACFDGYDHL